MPTQEQKNFWNNTIHNPYEPLTFDDPRPTPQERIAHAAEYAAHYLHEINEKLATIERLMKERANEP